MTNPQTATTSQTAQSLLRQNFYGFVRRTFNHINHGQPLGRPRYLEAMCFALQSTHEQEGGRLVVTVPPRHLKSIAAAVALPAWAVGHDPGLQILVATYGEELARQHAGHFADVIRSDWYRALFPGVKIKSSTRSELLTSQGGGRRSITLGGATTGFGADLIIVDDLMKAQDASSDTVRDKVRRYFFEALTTRCNQPEKTSIISTQQRLHEDDLPAHLIANQRYEHLNLPAIADEPQRLPLYFGRTWQRKPRELLEPERIGHQKLEHLREDLGSVAFSAQYQQDPVPAEGAVIHIDRLHYAEEIPDGKDLDYVVQSWDTAASLGANSDYSVCTTWGHYESCWYLVDLFRQRIEFDRLKTEIFRLKDLWDPDMVLIEDSSNGRAILQHLRATKSKEGFSKVTSTEPKLDRMVTALDFLHSDRMKFCVEDTWWPELRRELGAFPNGRHDDQVDSTSQFINWVRGRFGRRLLNTDPKTKETNLLKDENGRYGPYHGVR